MKRLTTEQWDSIETRNRFTQIWSIDVWQRFKGNTKEKTLSFQQIVLEQLDVYVQKKKKIQPNLHTRMCVLSHSVVSYSCDPMDCSPSGSSLHGIFPGKNTGVGCHFLLQEVFLTLGSNPTLLHLLHWQMNSLPPHHMQSPITFTPTQQLSQIDHGSKCEI